MLFYLYSTAHCHLCEEAISLLHQSSLPIHAWQLIDIAEDDALLTQYGALIPVLFNTHNHAKLCWPFTLKTLQAFIIQA
jgi:hypothetical protein